MAAIRIESFAGFAPAVSPLKLGDGHAQEMRNAKVVATSLEPERDSQDHEQVQSGTKSFYKYLDQYWLTFDDERSIVENPIVQDSHNRMYIAGGDYPQYGSYLDVLYNYDTELNTAGNPRIPGRLWRLGVPAPSTAPSVEVTGTPDEATADVTYTTSYVFTLVTPYGEEGPPSPPSDFYTYAAGHTKNITIPAIQSIEGVNLGEGAKIRIYRTASGSSNTEFLFVGEILFTQSSYSDTLMDDELGEVCPSINWYKPLDDDPTWSPDGPLKKIISTPNGFLAGFAGKTVCFSETFLPHAWNPANFLATESNIVTIQDAVFGVVILTETQPYVAVGSSPDSMGLSKLDIDQPCLSAKSAAEIAGMVVYASPDGLVGIQGNQTQLLTQGLITRDQWLNDYNPSSMRAAVFEGRYYAFFDNGTEQQCLVFDPSSSGAPFAHLDLYTEYTHNSAKDDALYYLNSDGSFIREYGRGDPLLMNWKSKQFFLPVDTVFAWGRVVADGDVQIVLYLDGLEVFRSMLRNDTPFRLPPRFRGRVMEIEVVDTDVRIDSIVIASSYAEL